MLQRQISGDGVVTYVSPLLREIGVPHAFSTRLGGVSAKPFDSLNLGNPNGCAIQDPREHIRENYRRLKRAAGCDGRDLLWLHQVHGGVVVRVARGGGHDNDAKADALVSDDAERVLSVRVADCVPVLLSGDDGRVVAAVHAGWRGVVAGVVSEAMKELVQTSGVEPGRVAAAIGPSIGFDAFEVGPEVLEEFERVFGAAAPIRLRDDGKGHIDLHEAIRIQLRAAGVRESRIDTTNRCTYRHVDEFYSHRRDNGVSGRMAAIISPASR